MVGVIEKVPPQNLEAEKAALGAMLVEKEAVIKAIEMLQGKHFYKEAHRIVFDAMVELFDRNEPVDITTLSEVLRKKKLLSNIGGSSYLTSLIDSVPTAANIDYYAKIIREKSILRSLINVSNDILHESYAAEEDADTVLDKAEQKIFDLSENKITQGFVPVKDMIHDTIDLVDKLYQKKEHVTGLSTGFTDFDIKTAGLHPSNLIIVAGVTSMGKTSFCLNIATHVGIEKKKPVAIFSLEMAREELLLRMLCSEARIGLHKVRTGFLGKNDFTYLTNAASKLSEAPIFVDDSSPLSVLEMKAKSRRLKAERGLSLIIVDYLQLINSRGRIENRQQEIAEISRSLKGLAKELKVPVIALSQLSRQVEKRKDYRPQLSDLRESGAIEQDADLVAFIFREEYYDRDRPEIEGIAEVIIAKQRSGPTGTIKMSFIKDYTRFENLSKARE
ncbi:MAG: replicative DNA helicase [bacterium]